MADLSTKLLRSPKAYLLRFALCLLFACGVVEYQQSGRVSLTSVSNPPKPQASDMPAMKVVFSKGWPIATEKDTWYTLDPESMYSPNDGPISINDLTILPESRSSFRFQETRSPYINRAIWLAFALAVSEALILLLIGLTRFLNRRWQQEPVASYRADKH